MADMIEHSNFVAYKMKQEWEDDIAKENEEIFVPKKAKSIIIKKNKDSIKILQHIRDETHRFGVAYNRSLRKFD